VNAEDPFALLTPRELEVLRLMSDGLSDREIAERLNVGWGTVRTHSQRVLQKLHVHKRWDAAVLYKARGGESDVPV
jgi:DNA-binding NarL/FixJ family response regulator